MKTIVACTLLLSALIAASVSAQEAAPDAARSGMKPASSIFRVDPAIRLDKAEKAETDEGWTRLGRLSSTTTVTVHVRDGRVLTGTIQGVRPESLDFAEEKNEVSVQMAEIKNSKGGLSNGRSVDLRLVDGRNISGKIIEVKGDSLRLINAGSILQLNRQDIHRIKQSVVWKSRFVGLVLGALAGVVVGEVSRRAAVAKDPAVRYEVDYVPAALGCFGAGAGFFVGPMIRSEKTLWENPAQNP